MLIFAWLMKGIIVGVLLFFLLRRRPRRTDGVASALTKLLSTKLLFVFQALLTFVVLYLLIPDLNNIIPGAAKKSVSHLGSPESAFWAVVLAFMAVVIAWRWNWFVRLLYLGLLLLTLGNAKGFVFPSAEGLAGNTQGVPVEYAELVGDPRSSDGALIRFDARSQGPHPILLGQDNLEVRPGTRLIWERVSGMSYKYRGIQPDEALWVSDSGNTSDGTVVYPRNFSHPDWFKTRDVPCGYFMYRIGNGPWCAPFAGKKVYTGMVPVPGGILWVDINTSRCREQDDGTLYYDPNHCEGEVVARLRVVDPLGRSLIR